MLKVLVIYEDFPEPAAKYLMDMTEEEYALLSPANGVFLGDYQGEDGDSIDAALCHWHWGFYQHGATSILSHDMRWMRKSGVSLSHVGKYRYLKPLTSGPGSFDEFIHTGWTS
ncbi:MAG: hypothetical protein ACRCUJ_03615 [Phocaeicola sp.]